MARELPTAILLALLGIKTIRPYERACVERLGKYQRTVQPGLNFIVPFIERLIKVDMREQVVDVPPQEVITKDNADKVKDLVSPGVEWCVKHGMKMKIVPYKKVAWNTAYREATEKYAGQVKLAPGS